MSLTSRPLKILLSEGSSLSARQTLYALGPAGHVIDVCDPKPNFCLARFSRYTHACLRCPSFGADPAGYLHFLIERLEAEPYDVLLPVHDQVFLLSRFRRELQSKAGLAVPEFDALEQMQSKARFVRLLEELDLPYPSTSLVRSRDELARAAEFPCYIKLSYSTAGCGVWLARNPQELGEIADRLEGLGFLDGTSEVLVQQPAAGDLCVVQSVFQRGEMAAAHCYQARALGAGGSARARISVAHPQVLAHLADLGRRLDWHGALMIDYLFDPATGRPSYIDANPRIGETFNATMSGVNLADVLVRVSLDQPVPPQPPSRVGVLTHSVITGLIGAAQQGASRRQLLAELWRAWTGRGLYEGSADELTRPRQDRLSLLPALLVCLKLLRNPRAVKSLVGKTVENYALTESTARAIGAIPDDALAEWESEASLCAGSTAALAR